MISCDSRHQLWNQVTCRLGLERGMENAHLVFIRIKLGIESRLYTTLGALSGDLVTYFHLISAGGKIFKFFQAKHYYLNVVAIEV